MSSPYFYKIDISLQTSTRTQAIKANIAKIDAAIAVLFTTGLTLAAKGDVARFELDTGQTKEVVEYRDPDSIRKTIKGWEELRAQYVSMLQPGVVRLMDSKNFHRRH